MWKYFKEWLQKIMEGIVARKAVEPDIFQLWRIISIDRLNMYTEFLKKIILQYNAPFLYINVLRLLGSRLIRTHNSDSNIHRMPIFKS
jgi:hypothetical protein